MKTLGLDTSNYTTSAAFFDGREGQNCSRLLDVGPGQLGLRQSDALFAHIKRLPEQIGRLFAESRIEVSAVGASTRPRAVEGSYMPCFLAGQSQAMSVAQILGVPFYAFSHQQGHIAAALWSADRLDLMQKPHLAWHLSGGTTELLLVTPDGKNVKAEKIGGTSDISAGQIVDRTGKLLGLPFPSGKALDALCQGSDGIDFFRVKCEKMTFSFSGLENKIRQFSEQGNHDSAVARYAILSICQTIVNATNQALKAYPGFEVVFSGGVASNSLMREKLSGLPAIFAKPEFSTDNAMGIAILTWMQEEA